MADLQEAAEAAPALDAYLDEKSADILSEVAQEPDPSDRSLEEVANEGALETTAPEAEPVRSLGRSRSAEPAVRSEEAEMAQYLASLKDTDPSAAADVLRQLADTYAPSADVPQAPVALDEWLGVDPEDLDGVTRAVAQSVLNQHNFMNTLGSKIDNIGQRLDTQSQAATEAAGIEKELGRVQSKYGLNDGDMEVVVNEMENRGLTDVEGSTAMLILEAVQADQQAQVKKSTPSAPTRQVTQAPPQPTQMQGQQSMIPAPLAPVEDDYNMEDAFREAARGMKQTGGY